MFCVVFLFHIFIGNFFFRFWGHYKKQSKSKKKCNTIQSNRNWHFIEYSSNKL